MDTPEENTGSLSDAIKEHLALKVEHGADPGDVDKELETALAPPRREVAQAVPPEHDSSGAAPAAPEPVAEPKPELVSSEPVGPEPVSPEPATPEPVSPEPVTDAPTAPDLTTRPDQPTEPPPPSKDLIDEVEFDWGEDSSGTIDELEIADAAEPTYAEQTVEQPARPGDAPAVTDDVLESTPEFFEETPEYDRLWFDQAPPRDFNFDE